MNVNLNIETRLGDSEGKTMLIPGIIFKSTMETSCEPVEAYEYFLKSLVVSRLTELKCTINEILDSGWFI